MRLKRTTTVPHSCGRNRLRLRWTCMGAKFHRSSKAIHECIIPRSKTSWTRWKLDQVGGRSGDSGTGQTGLHNVVTGRIALLLIVGTRITVIVAQRAGDAPHNDDSIACNGLRKVLFFPSSSRHCQKGGVALCDAYRLKVL